MSPPDATVVFMTEQALFDLPSGSDSWHTGRRVGFDLETTSRDPRTARIVSAALVEFDAGPDGEQTVRTREWLVNPGVEIPAETTAIHGISTERDVSEGQPASEAVAQLAGALTTEFEQGTPVVVMNAPYDLTVLREEAARHGVGFPHPSPVIDPLVIDKQVDKYRRGKRTLSDLCGVYEVLLDDAHLAAPDAKAAVEVADCMAAAYPQLQIRAEELHELQIRWKAEQAADFQAYLRRTKPDAVISGAWPL